MHAACAPLVVSVDAGRVECACWGTKSSQRCVHHRLQTRHWVCCRGAHGIHRFFPSVKKGLFCPLKKKITGGGAPRGGSGSDDVRVRPGGAPGLLVPHRRRCPPPRRGLFAIVHPRTPLSREYGTYEPWLSSKVLKTFQVVARRSETAHPDFSVCIGDAVRVSGLGCRV